MEYVGGQAGEGGNLHRSGSNARAPNAGNEPASSSRRPTTILPTGRELGTHTPFNGGPGRGGGNVVWVCLGETFRDRAPRQIAHNGQEPIRHQAMGNLVGMPIER